jgi:hypothetical protein
MVFAESNMKTWAVIPHRLWYNGTRESHVETDMQMRVFITSRPADFESLSHQKLGQAGLEHRYSASVRDSSHCKNANQIPNLSTKWDY